MKPELGKLAIMKKKHPCGGNSWRIIRVGADIKLECTTCKRIIFMERPDFERMTRKVEDA